jgi:glycine cleavage system transcriptional repressor
MPELVITAVGPDRPGLVDELTGFLTGAGANIGDARMVNLRGQFAVILLAEAPDTAATTIKRDIAGHGQKIGLVVNVALQDGKPVGQATGFRGVPFKLRTYAMDQPGIVHRITHLLHRHGVNIEELQTRLEAGAHTGTPLFTMELRMTVPPTVAVKKLRDDLEQLCDSLNCDVDLDPA